MSGFKHQSVLLHLRFLTMFVFLVLAAIYSFSPAITVNAQSTAAGIESTGTFIEDTASADVTLTVIQSGAWQSDQRWFYQYGITLTNGTRSDLCGWAFRIDENGDPKSDSYWNCDLKIQGFNMTFSSVDYNKKVTAGGQVRDIGCIISFDQEMNNIAGTYIYSDKDKRFVRISDSITIPSPAQLDENGEIMTEIWEPETIVPEEVPHASAGSAYTEHGKLSVKGRDLVDEKGNVFQLKGVSSHGLAWFPEFVNEEAFKTLRDSWGVNVVRLAMYTQEYGGYCSDGNKKELQNVIDKGVKAAAKLGMYVIIDWHILSDGDPSIHKDEAIKFFTLMSAKYRDYGNVIFELCNEPNGGVSWDQIKAYAEEIIPVIRVNSDAVILVGTPTWSQDVEQVIGNEVEDKENVMYTLHFYAGTHKDNIRNKLIQARDAGLPIFISEFSICDASGNGGIDYESAEAWKKLITENKISFCGWSLSNKAETSALIKPDVTKTSGWTWDELSETGQWLMTLTSGKE